MSEEKLLEIVDTPVWRVYKNRGGKIEPIFCDLYTDCPEDRFLTYKKFATKKEAERWLREFWEAVWRLC